MNDHQCGISNDEARNLPKTIKAYIYNFKNINTLDILAMPPLHLSLSQNALTGFVDNLQKILFGKFLTRLDTSQ